MPNERSKEVDGIKRKINHMRDQKGFVPQLSVWLRLFNSSTFQIVFICVQSTYEYNWMYIPRIITEKKKQTIAWEINNYRIFCKHWHLLFSFHCTTFFLKTTSEVKNFYQLNFYLNMNNPQYWYEMQGFIKLSM